MNPKSKGDAKIRLMLVEDHILMRMGLASATQIEPDMTVVAQAEDGKQAMDGFRKHKPDVVIVDLRLPGMSGLELIKMLRSESRDVKILVLTSYGGGDDVLLAIQNGAAGYVLKSMALERVLEAVRAVYSGQQYIPPEIAGRMGQCLQAELSPREFEVLRQMSRGRSNKEIASHLGIVEGTVKAHVTNIFTKLGAADRTQAITIAIKRQILQLE
jgi:DNA-binding NarL/FixJ family response regulator